MSRYSYGTCSECGSRVPEEDGVPIDDTCEGCGQRWKPLYRHTLTLTITAQVSFLDECEELEGADISERVSVIEDCDLMQAVEDRFKDDYGKQEAVLVTSRKVSLVYLQSDKVEED